MPRGLTFAKRVSFLFEVLSVNSSFELRDTLALNGTWTRDKKNLDLPYITMILVIHDKASTMFTDHLCPFAHRIGMLLYHRLAFVYNSISAPLEEDTYTAMLDLNPAALNSLAII